LIPPYDERLVAGPIRVLHVSRRYAPLLGGTERYIEDLAQAQLALGHRVSVLTLDRDVAGVVPGRLPAFETLNGVPVVRLPGAGGRRMAVTFRPDRLVRAVHRADVVHLHDVRFAMALAATGSLAGDTPLILHTHGLIFHTPWAQSLKEFAVRGYFGPLLFAARAWVVASSESDREALLQRAPYLAPRTTVLENAIHLADLLALNRDPEPGRLLVVGRVAASKGLDDLLRALALVRAPWRLEVAGPPDAGEQERLASMAHDLGIAERVVFTGPYSGPGLGELLARATAAIFPSRGEGFGLALLEAMAAGIPVLASNLPPHRALLGDDLGDRVVDFTDPTAAAEAIEEVLVLSRAGAEKLGTAERSRAAAFDVKRLAAQIDDLYQVIGAH
jgi:alpha-1,3-mannosyltransferase